MKKIMIALAIVACAAFANAATISWKTSTTGKLYEAGTTTALNGVTAYLFESSYGQQTLLDAIIAGGDITKLGAVSSVTVTAGAIAQTVIPGYDAGDSFTGYVAVLVDDNLFLSGDLTATAPSTGNANAQYNLKSASQAAAFAPGTSFSAAGWYQTVPEPTSGLLMLLGMAGLALRRRRA